MRLPLAPSLGGPAKESDNGGRAGYL